MRKEEGTKAQRQKGTKGSEILRLSYRKLIGIMPPLWQALGPLRRIRHAHLAMARWGTSFFLESPRIAAMPRVLLAFVPSCLLISSSLAFAQDWAQWGRDATRNMASPDATGLPVDFDPGRTINRGNEIDPASTRNIKWIAELGSTTYGNPTVAGGRVYVGTNNESPRDPKYAGDRSAVYCLDERTGEMIWQLNVGKLGAGKVSDWEYLGICSSPAIDGNRVYVITNLCEVVCLDVVGMANGNDGPFREEGQYFAGAGKPPVEIGKTDADVIWRYDMRNELGVFPHNVTSSSVLVLGDRVYATTSNGVDWSHVNIPTPQAPCLIALDKHTGELIAEEGSKISTRLFHGSWSSPAAGMVHDKPLIIFGAGDGFCYGFDPEPIRDEDGFAIMREQWRFDCNPAKYKQHQGKTIKYATYNGPSEIIGTPVFHQNRVYVATGQDPEHGEGAGALSCIDATLNGDVSESGLVWRYEGINRSISTVSVADGLVYAVDYAGVVHCLDADNGQAYWTHDTLGHIWGSTLAADGKVYIGNEDGILTVLRAGKQKKVIAEVEFEGPIYSSPIVANGTVYVATPTHLFAISSAE